MSYFENEYGEQTIFLYDHDEEEATIYVADSGWDNPKTIPTRELEEAQDAEFNDPLGTFINGTEKRWIAACIEAVLYRFQAA